MMNRCLIEPIALGRRHPLFPQQGLTRFDQSIELFVLLSDTFGIPFLGLAAGATCGLFHQLPEIVLKDSDTIVELRS
jgi:hypothetical protein